MTLVNYEAAHIRNNPSIDDIHREDLKMKNLSKYVLMAGVAFMTTGQAAYADDWSDDYLSKDRFQLRLRAVSVIADGDGNEQVTGLDTDVDHAVTPELDVTYFVTDKIALELIAATSEHTVSAGNINVGDAWIVPPTLTLQYHFTPDKKFSPYVGAGVNYSFFVGEDADTGFSDLDVDGGFGYGVQAGFDYWLDENWGLNVDAKYIDLDVDVDVNMGGTALSANDVDLDPFIIGAGVSYRF